MEALVILQTVAVHQLHVLKTYVGMEAHAILQTVAAQIKLFAQQIYVGMVLLVIVLIAAAQKSQKIYLSLSARKVSTFCMKWNVCVFLKLKFVCLAVMMV